jgi:hypothetical protein
MMEPIKFVYHGNDSVMNEQWAQEYAAFLIGEYTVVSFDDDDRELEIYKFSESLKGKKEAHYYDYDNERVMLFEISFNRFNRWHTFDLNKSLAEIIVELSEDK